jgi:hypothetical protein
MVVVDRQSLAGQLHSWEHILLLSLVWLEIHREAEILAALESHLQAAVSSLLALPDQGNAYVQGSFKYGLLKEYSGLPGETQESLLVCASDN